MNEELFGTPVEETQEQPRDQFGRFASQEEGQPEAEQVEEATEEQPQEDLLQQIRELKDLVTQLQQAKPEVPKRQIAKLEDEFLFAQNLGQTPYKALQDWFENTVGMTVEDFKAQQQAANETVQYKRSIDAANRFISAHPEYDSTNPKNNERMSSYIARFGWDTTDPQSYEKAYKELAPDGFITTKETPAKPATKRAVPTPKSRGGGQSGAPVSQKSALESETEKMNNMSTADMLAYMSQKMSAK